jgi:hypothetical protein
VRSREEEVMISTRFGLAGSALLALAGAAWGQGASTTNATIAYSLAWQDTGNHNGILEPGESAIVRLTATMTPPVNTIIGFTGGQGGPTGTLRGVMWGFIDLTGSGGTGGAWNLDPLQGYGVDPLWDLLGPAGYGTPNGTGLINIQFGQFPQSTTIITINPIVNVWQGVWTPASYAPRMVTYGTAPGTASGGQPSAVIIKWGPLNGNIQYATCLSSFGGVQIPIVPAPSAIALLGLGGLIACRRKRS